MEKKIHREFIRTAVDFSPQLADHIKELGPLPLPSRKHLGLAQFLARVIIGQQLSTKAAATIWGRIRVSAREDGDGIPGFFSSKNRAKLRACGASANKAKALIAINDAHCDGRLQAARIRRMTPDERYDMLLSLHGIGQWTIDMAAMFYFGDTDVWPGGDLSVSRTFERLLAPRQRRQQEKLIARFAPHRSYLAIYMWRIASAEPT